jgi:Zn-dependent metalloprotease
MLRLSCYLSLLILLGATQAQAAQKLDAYQQDLQDINQRHQSIPLLLKAAATDSSVHSQSLDLEPDNTLKLLETETDSTGQVYRYQQFYKDIPIYSEHIIIRENMQGEIQTMFGQIIRGIANDLPSVVPVKTSLQARQIARRDFSASVGAGYTVSGVTDKLHITLNSANKAVLVYVVSFSADGNVNQKPAAPIYVIDAVTGQILSHYDNLRIVKIGTGPGGNLNTGKYEFGTDYGFMDVRKDGTTCIMRNSVVRTMNMNNFVRNAFGSIHSFPCPRNNYIEDEGAYSPLNDAHYFATSVFDMYRNYVGKPPLNFNVLLRVHYGVYQATAFWNNKTATFGNGDSETYPFTVRDVIAHEISHGFTEYNSGLVYEGQSGAINEAFSDMAGEAFEYYTSGFNDFLVGKDLYKNGQPLRYMNDPTLDGKSIDHADQYPEDNSLDVHYSSGVYNKVFYLLATKPGWNTRRAFQLFANANDKYWSPTTNFVQGACTVVQAAKDMDLPVEDVEDAFDQVGISCGVTWEVSTAVGLHGGPYPWFRDGRKTMLTSVEPTNGMFGIAARVNQSRTSGKRYIEFSITRQRSAQVYSYSGFMGVVLRKKSLGVGQWYGENLGEWVLGWPLEIDSDPVAAGAPWLWAPPCCANSVINDRPLGAHRVREGDTLGMAIDMDNGRIWYSVNGVWEGDPVAGTSPAYDQIFWTEEGRISGIPMVPYVYGEFVNLTVTLRSSEAELLHPIPEGYSIW